MDCPEDIYEGLDAPPVEPYADYDPEATCDPIPKPGVLLFQEYVMKRFGGGALGITRPCNADSRSEHEEGRAWDWGIIEGADIGSAQTPARWPADVEGFLEWLLCTDSHGNEHANARRAGVMYVVHNRRIWRAFDRPGWGSRPDQPRGKWYPYEGVDPHTTHIHISFSWPGARGETSLYGMIAGDELSPVT